MGSFGAKKYVVVKRVDSIHPKNVFDYHIKESEKKNVFDSNYA